MNIHEFSGIPSQLSRNVLVSLGIKVGPRMRILDHIKTNRPSSSSTYSSPPINTITPSPQCLGVQSVDNNSIKTSHGFVGYSVTCEPAVCASDVSGPSTYAENFVQVEASDVVNKTATVDDRKSRLDRAVSDGKYEAGLLKPSAKENHITCIPCKQDYTLGKQYKYFSALDAHVKRPSHTTALKLMKERLLRKHRIHEDEENIEQVGSENLISPEDEVDEVSAVSEDQQSSKRMEVLEEVKSKFKETFEAGEHYLVCTYCSGVKEYKGSCRFKIFPQRGDLMKNLSNHLNSDIHKEMTSGRKKQKTMHSFFTSKQKP